METFSALLAICAGNSPVIGEFPAQRPVTRSFDVFFDHCPNKWLSKQSWGWWFEIPSRPLWRHCNGQKVQCRIPRYSMRLFTYSAARDDKVVTMTTFVFRCLYYISSPINSFNAMECKINGSPNTTMNILQLCHLFHYHQQKYSMPMHWDIECNFIISICFNGNVVKLMNFLSLLHPKLSKWQSPVQPYVFLNNETNMLQIYSTDFISFIANILTINDQFTHLQILVFLKWIRTERIL